MSNSDKQDGPVSIFISSWDDVICLNYVERVVEETSSYHNGVPINNIRVYMISGGYITIPDSDVVSFKQALLTFHELNFIRK